MAWGGQQVIEFLLKIGAEFAKALPVAIVRVLLLLTLIGAGALHVTATRRINILERGADAAKVQQGAVMTKLDELTAEVRGYRNDILDQNRLLREQQQKGGKQ